MSAKAKTIKTTKKVKDPAAKARKSAKTHKPHLPIVNVLPPRLALAEAKRLTRSFMLMAFVALAAALGMVFVAQTAAINSAQNLVTEAQADVARSQAQSGQYAQVDSYLTALAVREEIAAEHSNDEANHPQVLSSLASSLPPGGRLTTAQVTVQAAADPNAAGGNNSGQTSSGPCGATDDPFTKIDTSTVAACATFSGTLPNREALAVFLRSLDGIDRFDGVYITQTQNPTDTGIGFQGNLIVLKPDAVSAEVTS